MLTEKRKDALLQTGLALTSELSLPIVLQRIVELAVGLTDARYGALGVLGPDGRITEFITTGIDASEREAIGDPPSGQGILGALIRDARPLRLASIADDPRSVGFPPNHPPMTSFLGAPVMAHGQVFGNIYLAEKRDAPEFAEDDEQALVVLAAQAGVAVSNARLYEETRTRQRWLDGVRQIATAMLLGKDLDEVLGLVVRHARELAGADSASIVAPGATGDLLVRAADGAHAERLVGLPVPLDDSISGTVIRTGASVAVEDASTDPRANQPMVRAGAMGPAIFVPLLARGRPFGTLAVANGRGGRLFGEDAQHRVESFAEQAAIAVEFGRAQEQLQRLTLMEDRERIAKELHDGVIQSLFAVGMGLQGTALLAPDEDLARRIEGAVDELDRVVRDLRNYIFGLRPGILADRELDQALKELVRDFEEKTGVVSVLTVESTAAAALAPRAPDIVQLTREALSNVGRHAHAATVRVSLVADGGLALLRIDDDGRGFDAANARAGGNGLRNIRERAAAAGGTVEIRSSPEEGTELEVRIPF